MDPFPEINLIHVVPSDGETECNEYSEDPANPLSKPWPVPPSHSTLTVTKV